MELLPAPPTRLLDLGVATGWTSFLYAKHGHTVTGQDIAPAWIEMAKRKQIEEGLPGVDFIVQDFEEMAFNEAFDCAVFYDSLHHAENELEALRARASGSQARGRLHHSGAGHRPSGLRRREGIFRKIRRYRKKYASSADH